MAGQGWVGEGMRQQCRAEEKWSAVAVPERKGKDDEVGDGLENMTMTRVLVALIPCKRT